MNIMTPVLMGLLVIPFTLMAQTAKGKCFDHEEIWKSTPQDKLPLSEELMVKALHPKAFETSLSSGGEVLQELSCGIVSKNWSNSSGKIQRLLILETALMTKGKNPWPRGYCQFFGLWEGQKMISRGERCPGVDDHLLKAFDLARYKVSEKDKLLGFRTNKHYIHVGGSGDTEKVSLYSIKDAQMILVFETPMRTYKGVSADEEFEENDSGMATLDVLKTSNQGFFDLKKTLGKQSMVFRWDGKSYQSKDAEVVTDFNEL